jgi:hypothetical protein
MASSLKELIEEWQDRAAQKGDDREEDVLMDCISDLRDTMIVMEAEQVRKEKP